MGYVYLPIETVTRELDGSLLVAVHSLLRGATVLLGRKSPVIDLAAASGSGHLLYKDHSPLSVGLVRDLRSKGVIVSALDQEGLDPDVAEYGVRRTHAEHASLLHTIFLWGKKQREVILNHAPQLGDLTILSGAPRIDILAPKFRHYRRLLAKQSRSTKGHIQINLATAAANWNKRQYGTRSFAAHMRSHGLAIEERDSQFVANNIAEFEATRELVRVLRRRFTNTQIVVRPHPDESIRTVREAFASTDGVSVVRRGSHLGWNEGALVCISTNCTTGIEASLAGKHSINFDPLGLASPNGLHSLTTLQARDIVECEETVSIALSQGPQLVDAEPIGNWIEGVGSARSSEVIASRLVHSLGSSRHRDRRDRLSIMTRSQGRAQQIRTVVGHDGKYGYVSSRQLRERLDRLFAAVSGMHVAPVRVIPLSSNVWKLEPPREWRRL